MELRYGSRRPLDRNVRHCDGHLGTHWSARSPVDHAPRSMSVTGEKDLEQDLSDERAAGDVGSVQEDINPNGAQRPEGEAEEDVEEDEDEEDKEPNLKYTRLTPRLSSVYRNGDSTSSFQVSGDKMVGSLDGLLPHPSFSTSSWGICS